MKIHSFIMTALSAFMLFFPFNLITSVENSLTPAQQISGSGSAYFLQDIRSGNLISSMLTNAKFASPTFFDDNYILAYYGHPSSKIMGIVGRHPKPELAQLLKRTAATYNAINNEKGVVPAIYLIYGTCQPGGRINFINRRVVESYIEFAYKHGMLVYLDHQIGRYGLENAMRTLLPFLKYPNVHLAIDPEWSTEKPMKVIGHITADELNRVQAMMRDYMIKNNIPGKRQLVFHQFNPKMITNIMDVRSDFDPVIPVHTTSGWGSPEAKISTHSRNARAVNIPYKGFKLWYYYSSRPGVHYDRPLMTPGQVLSLNPEPGLIIYQ